MPTLNYKNASALVEYEYLHGTITALYPADDTADVTLKYKVVVVPAVPATATTSAVEEVTEDREEALTGVPIFYHCEKDSVVRSNGAIEEAAGGFNIDDNVVVLISRNSADSLGQKYYIVGHYYQELKKCGSELVLFVSANIGNPYFVVQKYKAKTLNKTGTNTFEYWEEVDLIEGTGLPSPYTNYYRRSVAGASSDLNSVIVTYLGYTRWGFTYNEPQNMKQRIPIVKYDNCTPCEIGIGYMFDSYYTPKDFLLSKGGACIGAGGSNGVVGACFETGDCASQDIYYNSLIGVYDPNMVFMVKAPCIVGNKMLLSMYCQVDPNPDPGFEYSKPYQLGFYVFESRIFSYGSTTWPIFLDFIDRRFVELTESESLSINQILYTDGKVYIFFNYDQITLGNTVYIKVYDYVTSECVLVKAISGTYDFARAGFINYRNVEYLYYATIDTWGTEEISPIYLADIKTLETVYQLALPNVGDPNFVLANMPTTDVVVDKHNQIRADNPQITEDRNYPHCYYLGKSEVCRIIAQKHLNWLIANNRFSHDGENGSSPIDRGEQYGIISCNENIGSSYDGVMSAIDGLCESPNHFANIINTRWSSMGWASGRYAPGVSEITLGPGMYVDGGYTTTDTTLEINPDGSFTIYVFFFAGK